MYCKRTFLLLSFHWVFVEYWILSGGHWVLHPSSYMYCLSWSMMCYLVVSNSQLSREDADRWLSPAVSVSWPLTLCVESVCVLRLTRKMRPVHPYVCMYVCAYPFLWCLVSSTHVGFGRSVPELWFSHTDSHGRGYVYVNPGAKYRRLQETCYVISHSRIRTAWISGVVFIKQEVSGYPTTHNRIMNKD